MEQKNEPRKSMMTNNLQKQVVLHLKGVGRL